MANTILNRTKASTTTTGTGTVTLGAGVTPYQSWSAGGAVNGGVYDYLIEDGTAWELGYGTYTSSGTTLSRTLVASSTGALLNLSGSATVAMVNSARQLNNMAVQWPYDPLYTFLSKPSAASYTLTTTSGGPAGAAIADLQNRGVVFTYPGSATATLYTSIAGIATGISTGDFVFTSLCRYAPTNYGNFLFGVYLQDNGGKLLSWGIRNTQFQTFRYSSINSTAPTTTTKTGGGDLMTQPVWWRITKSGGNFAFAVSTNGETYYKVFTESATAFLANTITNYGLMLAGNAVNQVIGIDCFHQVLA